jgi:hypothetical protein
VSPSPVRFQRILVPSNNHRHFHQPHDCWAYQFPHLLTAEECQQLIDVASSGSSTTGTAFQYVTQALHMTPDGQQVAVQLQNPNRHKLSVFSHPPFVDLIWNKLQKALSVVDLDGVEGHPQWTLLAPLLDRDNVEPPVGINPRLRVLRYDSKDGDDFLPHFDATTRIDKAGISLLTVLLYLNTGGGVDFDGGETIFWDMADLSNNKRSNAVQVIPEAGTVVVFEHDLYHSGQSLQWGTKYVLRTDLLFQMSEEQWENRARSSLSTPLIGDVRMSSAPTTVQLSCGGSTTNRITTISELVESIQEWDEAERSFVVEALERIGMTDATIDTFCAPGDAVMHQMLHDVLSPSSTFSDNFDLLVKRAFACQENRT